MTTTIKRFIGTIDYKIHNTPTFNVEVVTAGCRANAQRILEEKYNSDEKVLIGIRTLRELD
jgi:hypothetical protein